MKLSSFPPSLSASHSTTPSAVLPQVKEVEQAFDPALVEFATTEQHHQQKEQKSKAWGVFASTFVTIFLAEIGDKTQLTTMLMAAQSHSPWIVFAGAGFALVITSLLGVLLGQWLGTRIDPKTLEKSAGVTLLLISVMLLWEVLR
ncbi:TMEM165/GDT1 family protein [Kamptonema sp. UHCC 0994]|uniref:TMEM165/GDT1 family protein n=1 Tax=Kamptonema sp. UHCC 0994 TaxID=3031329 RepID=UPI0023B9C993|nr:TMEM165/GDT1 family protein [Kamptonema sp. UHCC 0994]MDF0552356.1 TMEM165/GDT1 family protein [Kamptonema sp. UHCC 0994]